MKNITDQIDFINKKLIVLFGLSSIVDYDKLIYLDNLKNTLDIVKINDLIPIVKNVFHVKDFNFHKTDNKIQSHNQALNMLVKCLELTAIPHVVSHNKKRKFVRLIPENNILYNYIMENCEKKSENQVLEPGNNIDNIIPLTYNDLKKNVKKETVTNFIINASDVYDYDSQEINIDVKDYFSNKNISGISLEFISVKYRKSDILSLNIINLLTSNIKSRITSNKNDGSSGWEMKFENCKNLLSNEIIVPLRCITYHSLNVKIIGIDQIIQDILNLLQIRVNISYVDFYSEFDKKLDCKINRADNTCFNNFAPNIGLEQLVTLDSKINIFRCIDGMWGMAYINSLTDEEYQKILNKKNNATTSLYGLNKYGESDEFGELDELDEFGEFDKSDELDKSDESDKLDKLDKCKLSETTIGHFKGCMSSSCEACVGLLCKYNETYSFACSKIQRDNYHRRQIEEKNNKYISTYELFNRSILQYPPDTISDLHIAIVKNDNIDYNKIKLVCELQNGFHEKNNEKGEIEFDISDNNNFNIIDITLKKDIHINAFYAYKFALEYESSESNHKIKIINISHMNYYWNTAERRELATSKEAVYNFANQQK